MENNKTAGIMVVALVVIATIVGVLWINSNNNDNNNSGNPEQISQAEQKKSADIVVLATDSPSLSTLVTAVKAASLVDTLQGEGPYTVFAPTNDAFKSLPAGTLDTLLKPENVDQLKAVLTYHVVAGKVMAQDLKDGQEITTVQGGKLKVTITDGKVYLTDAKGNKIMVEKADINASNGVVHVIGGVLLPS